MSYKPCDKCSGKGYWYDYGHSGEVEYYHECDKCSSTGKEKIEKTVDFSRKSRYNIDNEDTERR